MVIGACRITLTLHGSDSLKDKRSRLKPLLARVRQEFNVSAAETGAQDVWRSAEVSLAAVGSDAGYVDGLLQKAVHWVEREWLDLELVDYEIELITL